MFTTTKVNFYSYIYSCRSISPFDSWTVAGKKHAWIPDDKEAYVEVEIKERKGDKVTVETKDGRVSEQLLLG